MRLLGLVLRGVDRSRKAEMAVRGTAMSRYKGTSFLAKNRLRSLTPCHGFVNVYDLCTTITRQDGGQSHASK